MAKGNWAATDASTEIVPANEYRNHLTIQKTNLITVAIGIGEAAVAGEGIQLDNIGDCLMLEGAQATEAIYAIGNGGTGVWQDGNVQYIPGPYVVT